MRKVAFEIRDNSIQASLSYAGPSVHVLLVLYSSIIYLDLEYIWAICLEEFGWCFLQTPLTV